MTSGVVVLNGPNLNLLGERGPEIHGTTTLADIERSCLELSSELGLDVAFFQSNHEGALIDKDHEVRRTAGAVIASFGALSHTSLEVHPQPIVEVHLGFLLTLRHVAELLSRGGE